MASSSTSRGDAKRARLTELSRGKHVSAAAIESLLLQAKAGGIPDAVSRGAQHRARQGEATRLTPYGPLTHDIELPLSTGPLTIGVQSPFAMLYTACLESSEFADLMRASLARHPVTVDKPWHIVMYSDGIGISPLGHDSRKVEAIYWSFLEFGCAALSKEDAWFVLAAVRGTETANLPGTMSHLFKRLLQEFFTPVHNIATSGITLSLHGDNGPTALLVAAFGIVIGDERALAAILCCKGSAGTKPCFLCLNLVEVGHPLIGQSNYILGIDNLDRSQHKQNTNEGIVELLRRLALVPSGKLTELERLWGWNHEPNNVIPSLMPKPRDSTMFDWMRIYLVGGVFNSELFAMLAFLKQAKVDMNSFYEFLCKWRWPRWAGPSPVHLLSPDNIKAMLKDTDHFKGSASECLSLYPVIGVFLQVFVRGKCGPQIRSFLALCAVLDLLTSLKMCQVPAAVLDQAIVLHLELYKAAYGSVGFKPKHHAATHLAEQLARWSTLLCCFVHERRHKLVKRCLKDRQNLTSFEKGVMQELTLQHLYDLKERASWKATHIIDPVAPTRAMLKALVNAWPTATELKVSKTAVANGSPIRAGDVALVDALGSRRAAEVWFHADIDGALYSCVSLWEATTGAADCDRLKTYKKHDQPTLLELSALYVALVHMENDAGDQVTAIIPPKFRW